MDNVPPWVLDYIGAPYEPHGTGPGFDCMSLVRDIHARHFGWNYALPERDLVSDVENFKQSSSAFAEGRERLSRSIFKKVENARLGDVVLLRVGSLPAHVGLYLGGARMVHILKGSHACVEPVDGLAWGNRVMGYYHYDN